MAIEQQEVLQMLEINCETGEEIYRPLTESEISARIQRQKEIEEMRAREEAEAVAKAAAKQSAQDKLKALGLSDSEVAAITGGI